MGRMLYGSIDLSKIDKNKIVSKDKNGKVFENGAKYLNLVVWVNEENDQFGNMASIQESISKEDREKGIKATYIGNLKENNQSNNKQSTSKKEISEKSVSDVEDDLGF